MALVAGVDLTGCTRCEADDIEAYVAANLDLFDLDDDGEVEPLTDGLLTLRYLSGLRDTPLVAGAVDIVSCERCEADGLEDYIEPLTQP